MIDTDINSLYPNIMSYIPQKFFKIAEAELDKVFRAKRPGPWKMTWNRNAANYSYNRLRAMNEFLVRIVFENEQDEVWWLLKNGD